MNSPTTNAGTPNAASGLRVRRALFVLYAIALLVATHWPKLTIRGPIERPDLLLHAGAFGLWTLLLIACGFFGRVLSTRNILICAAIGAVYAPLDELSQSLPGLHRVSAVDDALANLLGIALAGGACLGLAAIRRA